MTKIHATLAAVVTCSAAHNHGHAIVRLTFDPADPFAVELELDADGPLVTGPVVTRTERDALAGCAAYGDLDRSKIYGTEGAGVTFKIRGTEPGVLLICFWLRPRRGLTGFLIAVDRGEVADFVTQVYDAVPAGREDVDIDRLAARLLYS